MTDSINAKTQAHIDNVRRLINVFVATILERGEMHDQSKFSKFEAPIFDEYSGKLKTVTYGSEEYRSFLAAMKPALEHHYSENRHHPEHFENGVDGMTLIDIVEMFLDWYAAARRHEDGNIFRSIEHNQTRFKMSPQLASIFRNTATDMQEQLDEPLHWPTVEDQ